eukprot:TRINITY_DN6810_c0_g1_i6.p1 TRINITY_DN6810_c0_g1~~TRINITY_DN6810_c0_g1_i6.p1  ORF type:complete len:363 (+),score=61.13 TRINITY_DN6810_c0_g1_i6:90-1178(+)
MCIRDSLYLWGRSMGAATALLCASARPHRFRAVVADSPFASLTDLTIKWCKDRVSKMLPDFIIKIVIKQIRDQISEKIGGDIFAINPKEEARKITCPVLIGVPKNDELTPVESVKEIYDALKNQHRLNKFIIFDGEHTTERPEDFYRDALNFLSATLTSKNQPPPVSRLQNVYDARSGSPVLPYWMGRVEMVKTPNAQGQSFTFPPQETRNRSSSGKSPNVFRNGIFVNTVQIDITPNNNHKASLEVRGSGIFDGDMNSSMEERSHKRKLSMVNNPSPTDTSPKFFVEGKLNTHRGSLSSTDTGCEAALSMTRSNIRKQSKYATQPPKQKLADKEMAALQTLLRQNSTKYFEKSKRRPIFNA